MKKIKSNNKYENPISEFYFLLGAYVMSAIFSIFHSVSEYEIMVVIGFSWLPILVNYIFLMRLNKWIVAENANIALMLFNITILIIPVFIAISVDFLNIVMRNGFYLNSLYEVSPLIVNLLFVCIYILKYKSVRFGWKWTSFLICIILLSLLVTGLLSANYYLSHNIESPII